MMSTELAPSIGEDTKSLEERVKALEEENKELRAELDGKVNITGYRYIQNRLAEILAGVEVNDYTADPLDQLDQFKKVREEIDTLQTTVASHQTTLDKFGEGKANGKEEAWYATVKAAENLVGADPRNSIDGESEYDAVVYARNIVQATGFSKRYALQLIEDWGEEKHGVTWFPYEPASGGNNNTPEKKRLLINLDVWGEEE